jgi:hypothetical protein
METCLFEEGEKGPETRKSALISKIKLAETESDGVGIITSSTKKNTVKM